jgi:hypothetical protein
MPGWKEIWKSETGWNRAALVYFLLSTAAVTIVTCWHTPYPHYFMFTKAAERMLHLQDPYGKSLWGEGGYMSLWFYSPTAATLFMPLVKLPPAVGQALYLGFSLLIFLSGLFGLVKQARKIWGPVPLGLFYLILSSEVVGSVHQIRIEILTAGILFWVLRWLWEERHPVIAGALMKLSASLKFQALPAMGLVAIVVFFASSPRVRWRFFAAASITAAITYLWPWLFCPRGYIVSIHASWARSLQAAVDAMWRGYQSLPAFFYRLVGWPDDTAVMWVIVYTAAALFAVWILLATLAEYRRQGARQDLLWLALALGGAYTSLFSPLSQGSAYILDTPALLLVFFLPRQTSGARRGFLALALFYWVTTSLIHSDLAMPAWRHWAAAHTIRPLGLATLTAVILVVCFPRRTRAATPELITEPAY